MSSRASDATTATPIYARDALCVAANGRKSPDLGSTWQNHL
jgi:hypothetical protein